MEMPLNFTEIVPDLNSIARTDSDTDIKQTFFSSNFLVFI